MKANASDKRIMSIPEKLTHTANAEKARETSINFGQYLPTRLLSNEEIESWGIKNPKGKLLTARGISQITGIEKRFVSDDTETPSFMGYSAAVRTIKKGQKPDAVLVSTSFPLGLNFSERITQSLDLLSVPHRDFFAACSGFPFILSHIKKNEKNFLGKRILIVASEKYSPFVHDLRNGWENSLAQTLFSDGAIAFSLEYGRDLTVLSAVSRPFPENINSCIKMPVEEKLMVEPFDRGPVPPYPSSGKFEQDGKGVLEAIENSIGTLVKTAIDKACLKPDEIKLVIPHQGSKPAVEAVKSILPEFRVVEDYQEGNWSSASIPKALMKAMQNGEIGKGDNLVFAGFGAGMFASIVVVRI